MKRQPVRIGDMFAIPLPDGSFGLGQVTEAVGRVSVVLFKQRSVSSERPSSNRLAELTPVFSLNVDTPFLQDGTWIRLGRADVVGNVDAQRPDYSQTGALAETCLLAYHGFFPWDGMHDRRFFEKLMVAGAPLSRHIRYRDAFHLHEGSYAEKTARTTRGPSRVRLTIMPSSDLGSAPVSDVVEALARCGLETTLESRDQDVAVMLVALGEMAEDEDRLLSVLAEHGLLDDSLVEDA